jgi:hypothetical protein
VAIHQGHQLSLSQAGQGASVQAAKIAGAGQADPDRLQQPATHN